MDIPITNINYIKPMFDIVNKYIDEKSYISSIIMNLNKISARASEIEEKTDILNNECRLVRIPEEIIIEPQYYFRKLHYLFDENEEQIDFNDIEVVFITYCMILITFEEPDGLENINEVLTELINLMISSIADGTYILLKTSDYSNTEYMQTLQETGKFSAAKRIYENILILYNQIIEVTEGFYYSNKYVQYFIKNYLKCRADIF